MTLDGSNSKVTYEKAAPEVTQKVHVLFALASQWTAKRSISAASSALPCVAAMSLRMRYVLASSEQDAPT